jgi:hypothetical protein
MMETPHVRPTTEKVACGANQSVTLILQKSDHSSAAQGTASCMGLLALKTLITGATLL